MTRALLVCLVAVVALVACESDQVQLKRTDDFQDKAEPNSMEADGVRISPFMKATGRADEDTELGEALLDEEHGKASETVDMPEEKDEMPQDKSSVPEGKPNPEDRIIGLIGGVAQNIARETGKTIGAGIKGVADGVQGRSDEDKDIKEKTVEHVMDKMLEDEKPESRATDEKDLKEVADKVADAAVESLDEIEMSKDLTPKEKEAIANVTADNMISTLMSMGIDSAEKLEEAEKLFDAEEKSTSEIMPERRRRQIGGGFGNFGSGFGGNFGGGFLPQLARFSRIPPFLLFNRFRRLGFPFQFPFGFSRGPFFFRNDGGIELPDESAHLSEKLVDTEIRPMAEEATDEMIKEAGIEVDEEDKKGLIETTVESMKQTLEELRICDAELKEMEKKAEMMDREDETENESESNELAKGMFKAVGIDLADMPSDESEAETLKSDTDETEEETEKLVKRADAAGLFPSSSDLESVNGSIQRSKRQFGFGRFGVPGFGFGRFGGFGRRGFFRRLAFNTGFSPFSLFRRFNRFGGRFPGFFGRRFFGRGFGRFGGFGRFSG